MGVYFCEGPTFWGTWMGVSTFYGLLIRENLLGLLGLYRHANALQMSISLHGVPDGEPGWVRLWDSREKEVYLGSFLGPRGY